MKQSNLHIFYSERFKEHETGDGPEKPERMDAVYSALKNVLPQDALTWREPRLATHQELELVHNSSHIKFIEDLSSKGGGMADDDTPVSPASFEIARLSTGACLAAVDAVCNGETKAAFVASRPPGHHACREKSMGFCIFNNIAIAARYAKKNHDLSRILIIDWDIHHGNGTQEIFYRDDTVFYFSIHQYPHYPGTGLPFEEGKGKGEGFTCNLPFPPYSEAKQILTAFKETIERIAESFNPELILVSAGFDGHKDDPLGNWLLEEQHYAELAKITRSIADKYCEGKHIDCLEGGYNMEALGKSCASYCRELI